MPDGITIESLTAQEVDLLEPLWKALLDHIATLEGAVVPIRPGDESWVLEKPKILEALAEDAFILVARRGGGEPIAYAFVAVSGPDPVWYTGEHSAELVHLSVAPGERGSGVGSALLDAVDAELARRGVRDMQIGVDAANAGAIRLYESRGYRRDFHIFYGSPGRGPWACLRREQEDRLAGRGRSAVPGEVPGVAPGASAAPAEEPGTRPPCTIDIVLPADLDLETLEPLAWELQQHLAALRPDLPARARVDAWSRSRPLYVSWLSAEKAFVVRARRGATLVGYALVEIEQPDEAYVTGPVGEVHVLIVADGERGSGLGGALLDAVDAELLRLGVADVILDYLSTNVGAERFYRRRGFAPFVNTLYRRLGDAPAQGSGSAGDVDAQGAWDR